MKKKILSILITVLSLCTCMFTLTACGGDEPPTPKYYTITWQNYDGSILEADSDIEEGSMPTYDSSLPIKEGDAEFTYEFSGWSPEIKVVDGDITYIAQFSSVKNKYTVIWKDYDGTVLETDENVEYGTTPSFDKENPTREKDAQYTYSFSGWNPTVDSVTGNVVYTAQYYTTVNNYTVTWKNYDGTILETDTEVPYGTIPAYNSNTPIKEKDAQYTYTFNGWSPETRAVASDVTYVAQFNDVKNSYTVTWKDYDGTVLELDENVEFGTTPSYDKENPAREKDAQYTYSFSGWNPTVDSVAGNVEYTAQYSTAINKYTVIWKNYDESVLETDTEVPYGALPTYNGTMPTRERAEYTYTFIGWDENVTEVTDNVVYTAQYSQETSKFTVVWKNYDGTVLKTDLGLLYQATPEYVGQTPIRNKDAQYTYTFSGWSPTISKITDDVVYTAQYSTTLNKYTVTWKNYDGTVLETDTEVTYGEMPVYNGNTPVREKDAQYTYTFNDWDKTISTVKGDIIYTAKFRNTVNEYTIIWKNYDGTILETDTNVPYGAIPAYNGNTPAREKDSQYTYVFNAWDKAVSAVAGDIIFTAKYNNTVNKYTVTWKNYDATVLETDAEVPYGTIPSYNGNTPTREKDAQYTYSFSGWNPNVDSVTGNVVYTAQYSTTVNKYTVTWKDYDGTILETDIEILHGTTPTYDGIAPTKEKDAQYTYTFNGWSPTISNVVCDIVYTAQFANILNTYTVIWKNYDGTILETDTNVSYGIMPNYNGETPVKNGNEQYSYEFSGWSPDVKNLIGNIEYIAEFNNVAKEYIITYNLDGGVANNKTVYTCESMEITLGNPTKEGYTFLGWSGTDIEGVGKDVVIPSGSFGNREYTANWEIAIYTIEYILDGGENHAKNPVEFTILDTIKLKNATKDGYSFHGWYSDSLFKNQVYYILSAQHNNLILYAKFVPNEYVATFDLNEGCTTFNINYVLNKYPLSNRTITITSNQSVNIYDYIPDAICTNFSKHQYDVFDGWCLKDGTLLTQDTYIMSDITLYARWKNTDCFYGWGSNYYINDVRMYVLHEKISETLTTELSYGDFSASRTIYFYLPSYATGRIHISFWGDKPSVIINQISGAGRLIYSSVNILQDNAELYLTPGEEYAIDLSTYHKVSGYAHLYFNVNPLIDVAPVLLKGNNLSQSKQIYDSDICSPIVEKRQGYDFLGWYDENDELIHNVWDYACDKEFYAKWSLHNYSISYELNGGVNSFENPTSYTINDTIVLKEPKNEGYTFAGWYTSSSFGIKIDSISGTDSCDYVLHAKWIPNIYTVYLDYDGGQNCPTIEFYSKGVLIKSIVLYDGATFVYFVPENNDENFAFAGWYTDSSCNNVFDFSGTLQDDVALYAKWVEKPNNYKVIGNTVEVEINGLQEQYLCVVSPYEQTVVITSEAVFDLRGTIYDSEMNSLLSNDDISDDDLNFSITITLKAGQVYYIGYKANSSLSKGNACINIAKKSSDNMAITGEKVVIDSFSVEYDDEISLPIPKKEGCTFIGWFDENDEQVYSGVYEFANDKTLTAKWEEII